MSGRDASKAQYVTPTPGPPIGTPTPGVSIPAPLPHTGMELEPLGLAGLGLLLAGVAVALIARRR